MTCRTTLGRAASVTRTGPSIEEGLHARARGARRGELSAPAGLAAQGAGGVPAAPGEDFLAVATPGAGQDHLRPADRGRAAGRRHRRGGHRGHADRAPEDAVGAGRRRGSASSSTPRFRNADVHSSRDFHGAVVTYAQVGMAPAVHRRRTMTRRTLVILDEIHHAGDSRSWGDGVKAAFEPAVRRLMLTGTPFRSDDNPIPFVDVRAGSGRAAAVPLRLVVRLRRRARATASSAR